MSCVFYIRFVIILAPCAAVHKLIILIMIINSYRAVAFGVNINGFAPRLFIYKIIYICACSDICIQKSAYCFALQWALAVNICIVLKLKIAFNADRCPDSSAHNNKVNICRKRQSDFNLCFSSKRICRFLITFYKTKTVISCIREARCYDTCFVC